MSAILGFIYWKSNGNLTYIIICHFVNNLFATFLLFWFNN
jgi:membrane protease YdiL (CAAX protease family)